MKRRSSVIEAVLRAYMVSVTVFAATIVVVGSAAMLVVVVRRDDANAVALARTLGTELSNHDGDSRPAKDTLIAHEREQRFVADAAHELRTPLTQLRAQLELASAELLDGVVPHARIAAAARTTQDLGRTMEILLALARNQATVDETIDLDDVVAACVASLPPDHAMRVRVELGEGAIVRGDEMLLRLAVGNLIDNALKYSPGQVEIRTDATEDAATVQIDDHGPGLTEAECFRLRAPFVRGATGGPRVRGVGLGLALVDHVATPHDGSLALGQAASGLRATLRFSLWRSAALGAG